MAIDMTTPIVDEKGQPCEDYTVKPPVTLTVGRVISSVLLATLPGDDNSPEARFARATLAGRLRDNAAAVLTGDELAMIEKRLSRVYGSAMMAQILPVIDPAYAAG